MERGGKMEWQIISVLVVLVGLFATITAPILKLSNTIIKLDNTCENLEKQFKEFEENNKDSHRRLWNHNTKQDEQIQEHENRIILLEKGDKE